MSLQGLIHLKQNIEEFSDLEDRKLIEHHFKRSILGLSLATSLAVSVGFLGYTSASEYVKLYKNANISNTRNNVALACLLTTFGLYKMSSVHMNRHLRIIYNDINEKEHKVIRKSEELMHESNYRAIKTIYKDK